MNSLVIALVLAQASPVWTSKTREAKFTQAETSCVPSGAVVGLRSTVTVTRATAQNVWRPLQAAVTAGAWTEEADNASIGKSNSGTGVAPAVTPNAELCGAAPDGTKTADMVYFNKGAGTAASDYSILDYPGRASYAPSSNVQSVVGLWVKALGAPAQMNFTCTGCAGPNNSTSSTVGTSWQFLKFADQTNTTGTSGFRLRLIGGFTPPTDNTARVCVWGHVNNMWTQAPQYVRAQANATSGDLGTSFFDDAPGVVSHVHWNGFELVESRGVLWEQQGTVPQVISQGLVPSGAGPFSTTNFYLARSLYTPSTDFYVCSVFKNPTTNQGNPISIGLAYSGAANEGGAAILRGGSGFIVGYVNGALINETGTALPTGLLTMTCVGRAGTVGSLKSYTLGGGSTLFRSGTVSTLSSEGAGRGARIGRYPNAGDEFLDTVHETIFVHGTPSEALYDRMAATAAARAKTMRSCGNNTLAVGPKGAEIYAAATNAALNSETLTTGSTANTGWALSGATATTVTTPPFVTGLGQWTRLDNTGSATGGLDGGATLASTTTATKSVWAWRATYAPATVSMLATGPDNTTSTACTCGREDGGPCTVVNQSPAANLCTARFYNIGSVPVRIWVSTTSAAGTNGTMFLVPGDYANIVGQAYFTGAQAEIGSYPTPYIVTTAAGVTRNASDVSIPLPAGMHNTNKWCFGMTVTPHISWATATVFTWGFSTYTGTTINAVRSSLGAAAFNTELWDSAGASRTVACNHGKTGTAPAKLMVCNNAGVLSTYVDGKVCPAPSGAGNGLWTATPANLYLARQTVDTVAAVFAYRDVKICPLSAIPSYCK